MGCSCGCGCECELLREDLAGVTWKVLATEIELEWSAERVNNLFRNVRTEIGSRLHTTSPLPLRRWADIH
jgi:hypothetical protein